MNDGVLIERVRGLASPDLREKKVFGAQCWVLDGNMAFGVHGDSLLVRLHPSEEPAGVTPFDPTGSGKPFAGWFLVDQEDLAEDHQLAAWIGQAHGFAATLAPK